MPEQQLTAHDYITTNADLAAFLSARGRPYDLVRYDAKHGGVIFAFMGGNLEDLMSELCSEFAHDGAVSVGAFLEAQIRVHQDVISAMEIAIGEGQER